MQANNHLRSNDVYSSDLMHVVVFLNSAEQVSIQIDNCLQHKTKFKILAISSSIADEIARISEYYAVIVEYDSENNVILRAYNYDLETVI